MSKKKTSTKPAAKSATTKSQRDTTSLAGFFPASGGKNAKPAPPTIPMIAGKSEAQKIAKQTARIAKQAFARVDRAVPHANAAADETKVKMSTVGKKSKAKPGKRSGGGMSGLDAAAKVLADSGKPMTSQEMVEVMVAKDLWKSSGKTPHATIYAAIIREIGKKGTSARFCKTDRGHFTVIKGAK